ncbi:MAG: hydrogenase maturation nickel metallochaperone HypA [Planctomycetes bacterium]|nr:hydrogenase maturation nickel metallochaperone HypA [Planctomycetota bacterium]
MHELSIALQILRSAEDAALRAGTPRVLAVHLQLGRLAGVVRESLDFAWDVATEGTPLAGAALHIEDVEARGRCAQCGREVELPDWRSLRCPECATLVVELTAGRELAIRAIEVATEPG